MRQIVVCLSDTHAGHRLGLMCPDLELTELDEEGQDAPWTPQPTATQEYLWALYQEHIAQVVAIAGDAPVSIIHNGDLTQGDAYAEQLVSTRKSDQIMIALANLAPWFEAGLNLKRLRLVHGTGSHVFREGTSTILVTEQLKAAHGDAVDIRAVKHGLVTVNEQTIDYAHHGPGAGIRIWTGGNQLRYYARSIMLDALAHQAAPPDLIVRGHFHTYVHETVRLSGGHCSEMLLLPSYCGMGEYGRQATRSTARVSNGLVVLELRRGDSPRVIPLVSTVDQRTQEAWT